jgi:hypothetical protein
LSAVHRLMFGETDVRQVSQEGVTTYTNLRRR